MCQLPISSHINCYIHGGCLKMGLIFGSAVGSLESMTLL